jgi:hypothetical protein
MAKIRCKGTIIRQTISASLTAVAQITDFNHDGAESETFDATTLDTSGAGKEYSQTGYSEGGNFGFTIFYDDMLAGHQAITDLVTTPASCVWNIQTTAASSAAMAFTSAGVGFGFTGAMNDGLKADVSLKITGLLAYST